MKRKILIPLFAAAMVIAWSIPAFNPASVSYAADTWNDLPKASLSSDFYGTITLGSASNSVSVNENNGMNVEMMSIPENAVDRMKSNAQKSRYWHYKKNDDGSYRILSPCFGNRPLEAAGTTAGSNVKLGASYTGAAKQKWFIYGRWSGEYRFKNAASNLVLNLEDASTDPGKNLQLWTYNVNFNAEKMAIYTFDPAGSTTPAVTAGAECVPTKFTWTESDGLAVWYDLKINKLNSSGGTEKTYSRTYLTNTAATLSLPAGKYTVKVISHSYFNEAAGNTISFTVGSHSWDSGTVTRSATCSASGSRTYTCSKCGGKKVVAIPATGAHKWDSGTVARPAKYLTPGVKTFTCTTCGATKSKAIPVKNVKKVTPAKVRLRSASVSGRKLTVKWKRIAKNTKGYQVAIKDKSTGKQKYYKVKQSRKKTLSKTIKKLKKGKTYAVRIRAYNKKGDEIIYGPWSKVKQGRI